MNDEYVCAITGRSTNNLVFDAPEDDPMDETPIGWLRITVERRGVNSAWVEIQQVKSVHLAQAAATYPEELTSEQRAEAETVARVSTDAIFAALEQATPKYLTVREVAYIRDPANDGDAAKVWAEIAAELQIEIGTAADDGSGGE
jgi:hypothetical protein